MVTICNFEFYYKRRAVRARAARGSGITRIKSQFTTSGAHDVIAITSQWKNSPCTVLYKTKVFVTFKRNTIGSHLSELQLFKRVGYPDAQSKATPTISGYFR